MMFALRAALAQCRSGTRIQPQQFALHHAQMDIAQMQTLLDAVPTVLDEVIIVLAYDLLHELAVGRVLLAGNLYEQTFLD